uniref:Uncharacterized protein n=1 Tax=Panagrolaimus davidi TaxID=227884 RepID=A0A914R1H3_9BILA
MTIGKWSSMTGYGIGFPKNSPHVQKVNQLMLQYHQKGDLERLQNFWLTGACIHSSNSQTTSEPLGIENFMSAFFLLGVGIIKNLVSILALSCEYIYCKHLRKLLQKIDKDGWCGVISMAMGKSLSFTEAVGRVKEWQFRSASFGSPSSTRRKFGSITSKSTITDFRTFLNEEKSKKMKTVPPTNVPKITETQC